MLLATKGDAQYMINNCQIRLHRENLEWRRNQFVLLEERAGKCHTTSDPKSCLTKTTIAQTRVENEFLVREASVTVDSVRQIHPEIQEMENLRGSFGILALLGAIGMVGAMIFNPITNKKTKKPDGEQQ
jgi:hypothetical protein